MYAPSQTTVLPMKRLNQTESPIFVILCVLCFQRQSFFTFIKFPRFLCCSSSLCVGDFIGDVCLFITKTCLFQIYWKFCHFGEAVLTSTHILCFWAEIRKIMYTPWVLRGSTLYRHVFVMYCLFLIFPSFDASGRLCFKIVARSAHY